MNKILTFGLLSLLFAAASCNQSNENSGSTSDSLVSTSTTDTTRAPFSPEWAQNATIYEVNTRQFSQDGTFKAIEAQLPRLKELGVDIVWLMPIHPISQKNKKGSLGSPYAVADYLSVNPNYGTIEDFKSLVKRAHDLGLRVIIDWVANHSGCDNKWVTEHPDYYTRINGKMTTPLDNEGKPTDWTDCLDLNFNNPELRKAMMNAMVYWVKECDIDGFRCDVAGMVPNDFWAEVRPELNKIKTVFMLSENEDLPEQFKSCFNMNYGWRLHHMLQAIAKGGKPATAIDSVIQVNRKMFPAWYYQMHFTQNHDENSWNGTLTELYGPGADAFTVLAFTLEGMPLVYNGMESNLNKRLSFFEKDPIQWGNYEKSDFYKSLLTLKHRNRALWNGLAGGQAVKIPTDKDDKVYAFYRQKENDKVTIIVNLSGTPQIARLEGGGYAGMYTEVFSRQPVELKSEMTVSLKPWEYRVFTN